ncbi:hypothetical protein QR680_013420 [Steinernema hermaphroditum]|uniref:Uncharacterized protein n=1 Tax=Steinernema hermaphroditum TaxID=289476 RepID=A0AA39I7I6_9BILA|nr:hypothetical protein QR680_013420 [Steinernema hermaphroditum]
MSSWGSLFFSNLFIIFVFVAVAFLIKRCRLPREVTDFEGSGSATPLAIYNADGSQSGSVEPSTGGTLRYT